MDKKESDQESQSLEYLKLDLENFGKSGYLIHARWE